MTPSPATVFAPRSQAEPDQVHAPDGPPSPVDAPCGPAAQCRIFLGALCYSTRRLKLGEAEFIAATIRRAITDGDPLVDFPAVHHEQVWVRTTEIRAIEVIRADALQRGPMRSAAIAS